jgi:hypothetical protein
MMRMTNRVGLAALAAVALGGCSSGFSEHTAVTISHYVTPITLTREHPTDIDTGITLVSIRADGRTTLRILSSGQIIRALPGGYFTRSPDFGREGLHLISASHATGKAFIERTNAGH